MRPHALALLCLLFPAAHAASELPSQVHLKSNQESHNSRYYSAVRDGRIWIKPNEELSGRPGDWASLPLPPELDGRVAEISSDDEYIFATDREGWIWTALRTLGPVEEFKWTRKWGTPLWLGKGIRLPEGALAWGGSYLSNAEDGHWSQGYPGGRRVRQFIGTGVTHVYVLRADGQTITYLDPWLPRDYSYQVCGPRRGRFQAVNLSASGSTLFVMNRFGDMYTRAYDLDLVGADTIFFSYSYEDQSGKPEMWEDLAADFTLFQKSWDSRQKITKLELLDWLKGTVLRKVASGELPAQRLLDWRTHYAARQLPLADWRQQPKIPGRITSKLSIFKSGARDVFGVYRPDHGGQRRMLRVEGMDADGRTGFWQKDIGAPSWTFQFTGLPLSRELLDHLPMDAADLTLGPSGDLPMNGGVLGKVQVSVPDFNPYCTPMRLELAAEDGGRMVATLHGVESLRQRRRPEGLSTEDPLPILGTIEFPEKTGGLSAQLRSLIDRAKERAGSRFVPVKLKATSRSLTLKAEGLGTATLTRFK